MLIRWLLLREFCVCALFCFAVSCFLSSFAIILMGKRQLAVAVLKLSSWCLVTVGILLRFLTVTGISLQCVIGVFPGHTH